MDRVDCKALVLTRTESCIEESRALTAVWIFHALQHGFYKFGRQGRRLPALPPTVSIRCGPGVVLQFGFFLAATRRPTVPYQTERLRPPRLRRVGSKCSDQAETAICGRRIQHGKSESRRTPPQKNGRWTTADLVNSREFTRHVLVSQFMTYKICRIDG